MPWLKDGREGVELLWYVVCYCLMMLQVDGCLIEDPGPLPGPRPVYRSIYYRYKFCYKHREFMKFQHCPKATD